MKKPLWSVIRIWLTLLLILAAVFPLQGAVSAKETGGDGPEVDPELLAEASRSDSLDFLIVFGGQVDLSAAYEMDWSARGWYVYEILKATADSAQAEVRAYLDQVGISYQAFWVQNVIAVEGASQAAFEGLFTFAEIEALRVNAEVSLVEPVEISAAGSQNADRAVESNLIHINADDAWALGYDGAGLVVGRHRHRCALYP